MKKTVPSLEGDEKNRMQIYAQLAAKLTLLRNRRQAIVPFGKNMVSSRVSWEQCFLNL